MIKRIAIIATLFCILGLTGCGSKENQDLPSQGASEPDAYAFEAQYIRTNGYSEDRSYPYHVVIDSKEELEAYYEANKDLYDLERKEKVYSDTTIGFLDACDKYDKEYFKDRILLMVLLEEGSGSIRHKVERTAANDNGITVDITTIVPEIGTDDMAQWHILIEPKAGVYAENEDDITVFIDGKDATEKTIEVYYEKGYANISLTLKEGWEYDIVDEQESDRFSVNIYPAGQKENKLRISYFGSFGVCGTGLEQKEIKLGKYDAWMGTYWEDAVWSFISIKNTFGDYAILNEGGEKWWDEYGEQAMQILETLKVADGYISENGAIKAAKDKADSEENEPVVEFDTEKNVWRVTLSGNNTNGEDTFVIDVHGNILDVIE